ncbi:MAG: L-aspartate oxidase [Hyphomicrobium aestuarii]|nr:L-aspartate oxidase [Hyphomicrobium aestuarii]
MATRYPASKLSNGRTIAADEAQIVIVGAGLAGLYTALKLAPLPVTVVAAAPLGEGASSVWAQGGVAAAVGEGDTAEAHAADTQAAGAGLVDPRVALTIAQEARAGILDLAELGVPFDRSGEGGFVLSREAAHSMNRVVRVAGDRAGAAIMATLVDKARSSPSIRLIEGYTAVGLAKLGSRISGVDVIPAHGHPHVSHTHVSHTHVSTGSKSGALRIPATHVVFATGGAGGLYAVTTNPPIARGEGFAIAARAGAVIADAEFVQFHPTAIDVGLDPAPLASEALRGEGAVLVNKDGTRFMPGYDTRADLAPRDVVARAVFAERASGRGAYLDCRAALGDRFASAFPTVNAACLKAGIDPSHELIPVAPAAHYHMGGIAADINGRTSVAGLWAVGEVASTGLHGANRLASNSLLEAIVVGARAALDVAHSVADRRTMWSVPAAMPAPVALPRDEFETLLGELRASMSADVGVVRDGLGLARAVTLIARLARGEARLDTALLNSVIAAGFIANAAAARLESRGGHYRSDMTGLAPGKPRHSHLRYTPSGRYVPEVPDDRADEREAAAVVV